MELGTAVAVAVWCVWVAIILVRAGYYRRQGARARAAESMNLPIVRIMHRPDGDREGRHTVEVMHQLSAGWNRHTSHPYSRHSDATKADSLAASQRSMRHLIAHLKAVRDGPTLVTEQTLGSRTSGALSVADED